MAKKRGKAIAAAFAALSLSAVGMLGSAQSAAAYDEGNLIVGYLKVWTVNCAAWGSLSGTVSTSGDYCQASDTQGGTNFKKQTNGIAVKVTVSDNLGMLAKMEFHPNGDQVRIYDTRNDGDSVYFQAYIRPPGSSTWVRKLPFTAAPGTSSQVDSTSISLDLAEGTEVSWSVADDSVGSQPIWVYIDGNGNHDYTINGVA